MPLSRHKEKLVKIKDELVYILKEEYNLDYKEIGYIFDMTKQGAWKAYNRHQKRLYRINS